MPIEGELVFFSKTVFGIVVCFFGQQLFGEEATSSESLQGKRAGEQRSFAKQQLKMRWCPPGRFKMGSLETDQTSMLFDNETPQIKVELTRGFWLGETELTQSVWEEVMDTKPWAEHGNVAHFRAGSNYPVIYVQWADAVALCQKLTTQEQAAGRLPTDWAFRLPTEAEWEYACRAATETKFSFGDDAAELGKYAWFKKNASGNKNASGKAERFAHAVGTKSPNDWGFHDMHGNVWEWCSDWHDDVYYEVSPGRDPLGPMKGSVGSIAVAAGY